MYSVYSVLVSSELHVLKLIDSISVCTDALNNLLNGSNPSEGTVQVCCNNRPNKLDAMVVCRDLNLNCR